MVMPKGSCVILILADIAFWSEWPDQYADFFLIHETQPSVW